jgi:tRNA-specific 2-thiouridylase
VAHSNPLYVLKKDYIQNTLVVGPLSQLGFNGFETGPVNWLSGKAPSIAQELDVKVRYKAEAVRGFVEPLDSDGARITFKQSLRDITPGQLAVFYRGDEVIGSGTILSAQAKPYEDESI